MSPGIKLHAALGPRSKMWSALQVFHVLISCPVSSRRSRVILEAAVRDANRRLGERIEVRYVGANLGNALLWTLLNTRDEGVRSRLNGVIYEVVKAKSVSEMRAVVDKLSAFL